MVERSHSQLVHDITTEYMIQWTLPYQDDVERRMETFKEQLGGVPWKELKERFAEKHPEAARQPHVPLTQRGMDELKAIVGPHLPDSGEDVFVRRWFFMIFP